MFILTGLLYSKKNAQTKILHSKETHQQNGKTTH